MWDIVARMSNRPTITPKQTAFATFVSMGDNNTEAYRKAYDTSKMNEQVIRNSAYKLAKNEKVKSAIESLKVESKAKAEAHEKLTNDWIVEQLQDEALNEKNPPATRVRALELLGKSGGLFDDSTHVTIEHRSPEDVEEELMEKLGVLFAIEA